MATSEAPPVDRPPSGAQGQQAALEISRLTRATGSRSSSWWPCRPRWSSGWSGVPGHRLRGAGLHPLGRHRRPRHDQLDRLENYKNIFTIYPPFEPAIKHNLIWLAVLFLIPTPLGIFLAVLLDKEMKGSRFYQTAFFLPVVLSLALVGFMWQLIYSPDQGLLNEITGGDHRLVRRPEHQPLGGAGRDLLEADRLRHAALPGRPQGGRPVAARGGHGRRRHRARRRSSA